MGIAPDKKKTEWFMEPHFLWTVRSQWPQLEQISGSLALEPGDPELKRCVNSFRVTKNVGCRSCCGGFVKMDKSEENCICCSVSSAEIPQKRFNYSC